MHSNKPISLVAIHASKLFPPNSEYEVHENINSHNFQLGTQLARSSQRERNKILPTARQIDADQHMRNPDIFSLGPFPTLDYTYTGGRWAVSWLCRRSRGAGYGASLIMGFKGEEESSGFKDSLSLYRQDICRPYTSVLSKTTKPQWYGVDVQLGQYVRIHRS